MRTKKILIECQVCQAKVRRYRDKKRPQLFCSRACYLVSDRHKAIQREKMFKRNLVGERNPGWIGTKIGYKSLHGWIKGQLGSAKQFFCECCFNLSGSLVMNWANLDGKYSRDLSTWSPLCKICHSNYDQLHFETYSSPKKSGRVLPEAGDMRSKTAHY